MKKVRALSKAIVAILVLTATVEAQVPQIATPDPVVSRDVSTITPIPSPEPLTQSTVTESFVLFGTENDASEIDNFVLALADELFRRYESCGDTDSDLSSTTVDCQEVASIMYELLEPYAPEQKDVISDDERFKITLIGTYGAFLPNIIPAGDYKGPLETLAKLLTDPSAKVAKAAKAQLAALIKDPKTGKATKAYLKELTEGKALDEDQKKAVEELIK